MNVRSIWRPIDFVTLTLLINVGTLEFNTTCFWSLEDHVKNTRIFSDKERLRFVLSKKDSIDENFFGGLSHMTQLGKPEFASAKDGRCPDVFPPVDLLDILTKLKLQLVHHCEIVQILLQQSPTKHERSTLSGTDNQVSEPCSKCLCSGRIASIY